MAKIYGKYVKCRYNIPVPFGAYGKGTYTQPLPELHGRDRTESRQNLGTPKWMVKIMVPNPIKMDDLEVPLFLETPISKYIYIHGCCQK